ncbi:hypothetical protein [Empedobacter sp. GD03865]|nr:hypothetical protein [Empedobacter sp. GD03865]MDH0659599.1 hypothetical protein [Empedobacter sp. GD03865]
MLSTEFISWQKSEYDLTAEPVIIKYQDFIIKLIKDGDMKIFKYLDQETKSMSKIDSVSKMDPIIYQLYKLDFGEPELAIDDKYIKTSKEQIIAQLFSPRVVLTCVVYVNSNKKIIMQ